MRLTAALIERLAPEPHTRLRYFCSPQHTDSALYPIITQMERAAGFVHEDTVQSKQDKLDALLAQSLTAPEDAVLLLEMLSLPNGGRYSALELDPQQQRQMMLEALTARIAALSRSNPLLMIFGDVHWIDPTSFDWRCLSGSTMAPFPHPAHRTGQADFPHPALGQDFTPLLSRAQ